jgi:hypothetical protein
MSTTTPSPNQINNPTKEILASSGIYDGKILSNKLYANDLPNSTIANTGINVTSTTTSSTTSSTTPSPTSDWLLSSGNYFIDDMLVFNNYIHYDSDMFGGIRTFDPQSFLEQATATFNVYSMEYRS